MKIILALVLFFITTLFLSGCHKDEVTEEECVSKGLIYKKEKLLNYRTGKYEMKGYCTKKK